MKKRIALTITLAMAFTVIAVIPATENAFAAEALKKPVLTNHAAGKTSVKNTWSKVKGADGYEVYRAVGKEKLKKVKTIESGKTLAWTDKKAKKGKPCYYAVRAYQEQKGSNNVQGEKAYGKLSAEEMAIPTNQPNWNYTLDKKTKKTKTLKVTITNKGMHPMKIQSAGAYLKDKAAFSAWNYKPVASLAAVTPDELQGEGITPLQLKKKVTIKPGKTATLTYRADAPVKYAKAGRIVSQFRSGGKTYGMWHSLKNGSALWSVK